jgi:predicted nucleotidyltransferase
MQSMDNDRGGRPGSPSLLPILRSQQQGVLLAAILDAPDVEFSLADLGRLTGVAYPSVHREVERAERAGIVQSRRLGNVRLVRANTSSPYFEGLASVLVRAFGPPAVIAEALMGLDGIEAAYLFGSWAARFSGDDGERAVNDLDLLVLGEPDRSELFEATSSASHKLGREVQVTIRDAGWLTEGKGPFRATVKSRALVQIPLAEAPDQ